MLFAVTRLIKAIARIIKATLLCPPDNPLAISLLLPADAIRASIVLDTRGTDMISGQLISREQVRHPEIRTEGYDSIFQTNELGTTKVKQSTTPSSLGNTGMQQLGRS